jgi:SAM-dependent methyltransferase
MSAEDRRRSSPAAQRNREPILGVLRDALPEAGTVLEVASGSGEHLAFFAREWPELAWQPSDPSPEMRESVVAWCTGLPNVMPPVDLDASAEEWPVSRAGAMVCINMVHISPWAATEGLLRGAGRILAGGAPLVLYGPYRRTGVELEPSNEAFDQDLKRRNPDWGLRKVEDVAACAARNGLRLERQVQMPANNLSLVFRKI